MQVVPGDTVITRDGSLLRVTDANAEDNIFIGYHIHPEIFEDPQLGEPGYEPRLYVSDMSEIAEKLDDYGNSIVE